jgi:AhpD family alkylhydroperoxidase
MKMQHTKKFMEERKRLNGIVMKYGSDRIKRFYSLDALIYKEGALSKKFKEMLGLVASLVMRCDECIMYHTVKCFEHGVSNDELEEALAIGLIVGGSITIPHIRTVFQAWDDLRHGKDRKDDVHGNK